MTIATHLSPTGGHAPGAQPAMARRLRELHQGPDVLVLANAWDAGSAALLAALPGVRALATTSAGVAAAHGVPDGELLALDHTLALVARICRTVDVPVSVDLEAGYGNRPEDVADSVASVIEAGAAGVNLEDGDPAREDRLLPPSEHAERISAACSAADQLDTPIVVNARTDVYWRGIGAPDDRLAETARRLRLYADAGADCLFVPGFPRNAASATGAGAAAGARTGPQRQREMIGDLVAHLDGVPLNLLAGSTDLPVHELRALGVRRLSVGSALYRLGMAAVCEAMGELLNSGRQEALAGAQRLTYAELARTLAAGVPAGEDV